MDTSEHIGLEVKAQFLYNVYQEWENRTDYQDEPIYTYIKAQDFTRALVTLYEADYLELETGGDMEYYINRAYDRLMLAIEQRQGKE